MKTPNPHILSIVAAFALIGASVSAPADGFAPWNDRGPVSAPDPEQRIIDLHPYYRAGLPDFEDTLDAVQARVNVDAWYAPARRLPVGETNIIELAGD